MSNCPRCFHQNPADSRECELCGSPLASSSAGESASQQGAAPSAASILAALAQADSADANDAPSRPARLDTAMMAVHDHEVETGMRLILQDEPSLDSVGSAATLTAMGSGYRLCPRCAAANDLTAPSCLQCGASLEHRRAPAPGKQLDTGMFLVAINEDGTDGTRIPLDRENSVVGRAGEISYPGDVFLSPRHAVLIVEDGQLHVEDLSSLNGTYLKLREKIVLNPGDTFLMGRQVLRVQRFENELAVRTRAADGTRFMGSPAPTGRLKIEQVGVGGLVQDVYCLSAEGATIGREKGDVVFPRDKFMSSRHARIWLDEDGEFYLADENSSNGSWLKIWQRRTLSDGDFLFLGQQLFRVEIPR